MVKSYNATRSGIGVEKKEKRSDLINKHTRFCPPPPYAAIINLYHMSVNISTIFIRILFFCFSSAKEKIDYKIETVSPKCTPSLKSTEVRWGRGEGGGWREK